MKRICTTILFVASIVLISACGGVTPEPVPTEVPETDDPAGNTSVMPNVQGGEAPEGYPGPEAAPEGYPAPEVAQLSYPVPDDIALPLDAPAEQVREQVVDLLSQGDYELALSLINRAIYDGNNQDNLELLATQAAVFTYRNRYAEARNNFNLVLEQDPDNITALVYQGVMSRRLGNLDAALSSLNQALDQAPDNASALAERARVYILQEDYDQALADANAALEITDDLAWAYVVRARVQAEQGNHEEARVNYERAIDVAPNLVEPAFEYGTYLLEQSEPEAAREQFQYVLSNGIPARDSTLMQRASTQLQALPTDEAAPAPEEGE